MRSVYHAPHIQHRLPFSLRKVSLLILGLVLIISTALVLFSSSYGWLGYSERGQELKDLESRYQEVVTKNQQLRQDSQRLKDDPQFLAEIAKKELNFVAQDEQLYIFKSQ